jgi:hypothetical protein
VSQSAPPTTADKVATATAVAASVAAATAAAAALAATAKAAADTVAALHTAGVQAIARRQADRVQQAWRLINDRALAVSYREQFAPLYTDIVSTGQTHAAATAGPYVAEVLEKGGTGKVPIDTPQVIPSTFGGATSDGLPLEGLANYILTQILDQVHAGMSTVDAVNRGKILAVQAAANEVTDAARLAVQTQMIADPRVIGHARVVPLPACDRCIVLAGKFYRYSDGFLRHTQCDCGMRAVTQAMRDTEPPPGNTPKELFAQMTEADQNRRFGFGGAEAIRLGGNISQVVNSRGGRTSNLKNINAYGRTLQVTTAGTSKRALYGGYEIGSDGTLRKRTDKEFEKLPGNRGRTARPPRLTAGQIVKLGGEFRWNRDELVGQLRRFNYLL